MEAPTWRKALASADLIGGMRAVILAYRDIVVARSGGRLYAFSGYCPHRAVPLDKSGELDGCMLTCTHHGWRFDLDHHGCEIYGNRGITMFPVKEEDGAIYVRV
jgi:nitrite reductase/ring-hydroxylating ferredoxin subunit